MINKLTVSLSILVFIICNGLTSVVGQNMPKGINVSSPSSENLKIQATAGSNLYNGSINVDLPITSFKSDGIEIPITLKYNSNGIKVTKRPTWVGIGWDLNVGGEITRSVRGLPDEQKALKYTEYRAAYYDRSGYFFAMVPAQQVPVDYNGGYLYTRGLLNNYSGNTTTFVNNTVKPSYENKEIDLAPDEFFFNCNGISGSFFFAPDGGFRFKSRDCDSLRVEYTVTDNFAPQTNLGLYLPRAITSFKITDRQGFQYFFGGEGAIEYDRPAKYVSGVMTCMLYAQQPMMDYFDAQVTVNTWKLTKIVAPNNNFVSLKYITKDQIIDNPLVSIFGKIGADASDADGYDTQASTQKSMTSLCLLDNISDGAGNKMQFEKEISSSLGSLTTSNSALSWKQSSTGVNASQGSAIQTFGTYGDRGDRNCGTPTVNASFGPQLYKLSKIVKSYNDQLVENYKLDYRDESDKRLRLLTVSKIGMNNDILQLLGFTYNAVNLPGYTSKQDDNWGYYNGKDFFSGAAEAKYYNYNKINNDFISSKLVDSVYTKAELLEKITYGTGGTQKYSYESNDCSRILNYSNFQLQTTDRNLISGGVRVKKIELYDEKNVLQSQKIYHYIKSYTTNGNVSSGIQKGLTKVLANYVSNLSAYVWSFNPISVVKNSDPDGNVVTYSEVTEETKGAGFKTYYFRNNDNTNLELAPDNVNGWRLVNEQENFDALQAGLPYKEEHFDENKLKIYEKTNEYQIDLRKYLTSVSFIPGTSGIYNINLNYTNKIYTYCPYLLGTVEKYFNAGGQSTVESQKRYVYDPIKHNLIYESESLSTGETKIKRYFYPDKFAFSGFYTVWKTDANGNMIRVTYSGTNIYSKMMTANMSNVPIEIRTSLLKTDGTEQMLEGSINSYNDNNPSALILPQKELMWNSKGNTMAETTGDYSGLVYDQGYEEMVSYNQYSTRGKLLNLSKRGGAKMSYLWSYNYQYPIAEIMNTEYSDIENTLGKDAIQNFSLQLNPSKSYIDLFIAPLKTAKPNVFVTVYSYKPLVGIRTVTDINGINTYYDYDNFQRLRYVRDKDQNIIKSICYNYAGQVIDCYAIVPNEEVE
jgi:hypothetical protein